MRSLTKMLPTAVLGALALGLVACAGSETIDATGATQAAQELAQLPDCSAVSVLDEFQAAPSSTDGIYLVRDAGRPVCATDFDGLQALAYRLEADPATPKLKHVMHDASIPRGQGDAASNPMPGQGDAASNPMPGQGDTASNPMPGHDPTATGHGAEIARAEISKLAVH